MPPNTIHVHANSEEEDGHCMDMIPFGYIEICLRFAGVYFDPRGHYTVIKGSTWKMKSFYLMTSFATFIYLAAYCTSAIKTLFLMTPNAGFTTTNVLVSFLLPKRLPQIVQKITITCSEESLSGFIHFLWIMILILLIVVSFLIYEQSDMYLNHTDRSLSLSDSIRLYPTGPGTMEQQFLAYIYTWICIMFSSAFIITAGLMVALCVILGREFSIIARRLHVMMDDKSSQDLDENLKSKNLEELRQHYETVNDVVTQCDGVLKYTALIGFLFGILVFCFGLFSICRDDQDHGERGSILLLMATSLPQILVYTMIGCYLNDKAHSMRDVLLKYDVSALGGNAYKTIHLFLARVSGQPIGITVLGTFTIDRSSTLTVLGTILSYAVLVLQLAPTSSDKPIPCYNVTETSVGD